MKQTVLFVHGIGQRNPFYAEPLIEKIQQQFAGFDVEYKTLYYGNLLQAVEQPIFDTLQRSSAWNKEHFKQYRASINEFLMDALRYWDADLQKGILTAYRALNISFDNPLHIVTHSWGAVVFFQLLLQAYYLPIAHCLKSFTTLGCALHYVYSALPQKRLDNFNWTNCYHAMDLIGVPLNILYGCTDVEIKDAGPSTTIVGPEGIILAGLAHNCYWESNTVAELLVNKIKECNK